jgi:hypothetical protein
MALMLVLTVASVLVMMTGAFVATNHANFTTLAATQRQREALLASESGVSFVFYKLEHNERWARDPFTDSSDISPGGGGLQVKQVRNTTRIEGSLIDEQSRGRTPTFTVEIYNNLSAEAEMSQPVRVPKDSVLMKVVGRSGAFESRIDVMFRGEPLYDASLTANKEISLGLNEKVQISSEDPSRNWVRSNENIKLGQFAQDGGNSIVQIDRHSGGPKGVLWAKKDIYSGNDKLEGQLLNDAARKSGGIMAPKSRLNHDIYKLELDDLNVGGEAAKDDPPRARMPAGRYMLSYADVGWMDGTVYRSESVRVLSHVDPAGKRTNYYNGLALQGDNLIFPSDWDTKAVRSDTSAVVPLGTGPEGYAMTYNFDQNVFTAASNATIEVDGDLSIWSARDGSEPQVKLLSGGSSVGVIKAKGNISIQGTVSGGGALLAGGDLTLMANSQHWVDDGKAANVDADQESGVVLYGNNVRMYGGKTQEMSFKGLIYADNDFQVFGGAQVATENGTQILRGTEGLELKKLDLEGAVVARQGSILIADTKDIHVRYNQHYLKALVKGMPGNRRRIQHLWSRSY